MSKNIFITGTDTEVGKTYVSAGLLQAANQQGLKTVGLKPVASGCTNDNGKLLNEDALLLQKHASQQLDYDVVNPLAFQPAIAPHIVAEQSGTPLSVDLITQLTKKSLSIPADIKIIEGFGGWYAPLNVTETMADYAKQMQMDVLMVVGIRLGCLNHATLTYKAIINDGLNCIGWIANCIDPDMQYADENIETLKQSLAVPCFGIVRHSEAAGDALANTMVFSQ